MASVASVSPAAPQATLRRLILKGSAVEMMGYGAGQVVRFGSNLVLSRLLSPQAFGLMALVNIVNQGLIMFSDAGLHAAVIQSEQGEDPRFLNTIFSWQAARGFLLCAVACLVAWPLSRLYHEPMLRVLIPVGSLSVAILGFHSTSLYTLRRRMTIRPLVFTELGAQVVSVVVMLCWAVLRPSVWALLAGVLISALVTTLLSHLLRVGYRNHFQWDKESARAMFEFGKWLAGSSMLTFLSAQGDRLLLGHFLGTTRLGVYSVAVMLSGAFGEAISRIASGVLFPAYSRAHLEGGQRLREVYQKSRFAMDVLVMPALGVLSMVGSVAVRLLYDGRYAEAGWMFEVLSVRIALGAVVAPCQFCLLAVGQPRYGFWLNLARATWLAVCVPMAYYWRGVHGLVWAVALCELAALAVALPAVAKHIAPRRGFLAPLLFGLGAALGLLIRQALERNGI
jgi:O-antigen/teichoic acid export membrane protein